MAKRRMLSISLLEADRFYDLSAMTQALYLHLNLNADDDGLVDNVRSIMRDLKATKNNLSLLIDEGYVIDLGRQVIAITHWQQHNRIKSDRYTPTAYKELMSGLSVDEEGRYFKASEEVFGDKRAPQDSIGKDSIGKDSIGKGSTVKDSKVKISTDEKSSREAEEKKKEEKEKLSLFLTNNHSEGASPPDQQTHQISSSELSNDKLTYASFLSAVKLYFLRKYQSIESVAFIEYYEAMDWTVGDLKIDAGNYKIFADEWMKR